MNTKKLLQAVLEKKIILLMALFIAGVLAVLLFQKSCGGGYESSKYLELKGRFAAHKETAEQKEKALEAMDEIVTEENATLRGKIDKLEIEKGEILADSAEINKKIFEKDLELKDLYEKESEITSVNELVINLRAQIFTLQDSFSLAIEDRDKFKAALTKAEGQIVGLNLIIDNKTILETKLRAALAAEIVARKACEGLIKVGEKNTIFNKLGKLAGNGFKLYGIYSAGRDLIKAVNK